MVHHWFTYPSIDPVAFRIGPLAVHWYGISYLVGFICVYLWMSRAAGRKRLGLTRDEIQDFLFYALVGVVVGGRTLFVIADILTNHNASMYFSHPIDIIAVWTGGMAFHGGMIGVMLAIWLYLRKHPRLTYLVLGDEVVMLLPIGITLTRFVNFINDELWGRVCVPDQPWCMIPGNPTAWGTAYRHPSQFYEAALDLATLPILLLLYRTKPKDGVVGWTWFMLYGITRSVAEIWRDPGIVWFGITGGQWLALPMIAIGAFGIWWCLTRGKRTDETPLDAGARSATSA